MYWYWGEHFDFLVSFLQEWVFFPYGHPTESWYIEIAEHIVCVHYRIIFRMRTRAQWMLESRKRANSGMLSILGIGKFRGFLLHERYLSPVEVFFPLHFFVHILLFDRCIYCRCTVPDLRWCKWSIFTNSRRLIWQSWTNMKIIRLCCGFSKNISKISSVVILESKIMGYH